MDILEEQCHISHISWSSTKFRDSGGVWFIAIGHWGSVYKFYKMISWDSHYFGLMDVYGCGGHRGTASTRVYSVYQEILGWWSDGMGECFSYYSLGPQMVVHGSMNSQEYCTILDNEMLLTLWRFYGMDPCYFQNDNASCHVPEAMVCGHVHWLDWSAQTPDLIPTKHLWDKLDRQVRSWEMHPNSIVQIKWDVARGMATHSNGCPA